MRREFGASIRNRYFVDIESCPPDETERELIRVRIRREMEEKNKTVDESTLNCNTEEGFRAMALNGDCGRVLCIGLIAECGGRVTAQKLFGYDKPTKNLLRDEGLMLSEFWQILNDFNPDRDIIVGHNIFDFDLLFLYKRSIINRVRPTLDLSFARYRAQPVYDTMREWEKWGRKSIGLGRLADALGLESSKTAGIDGSKVYDYLRAGRHHEIAEYCFRDVVLTRQIYYRMNFMNPGDDGNS